MTLPLRTFAALRPLALVATWTSIAASQGVTVRGVREEMRIVSNDADPSMQLTPVASATVFRDGRIVTVHSKEGVVRVFAPTGKLIQLVGRLGSGPGEFRSPYVAGSVGDTLWVRDDSRGAYLLFGPDLVSVGQLAIGGGLRYGLISNTTSLAGGSGTLTVTDRDGQAVRSISYTMRRSAPQYEVPSTATTMRSFGDSPPPPTRKFSQPMTAFTSVDLLPGGRECIVVEDGSIWGGQPGQFTLRRITLATGRISAPITVTVPAKRVSQAQADSIIKAQVEWSGLAREYWSRIKLPPYFPALETITPSADGVLWLQDNVDPSSRLVIDLDGKPLMRVRLPAGLRVLAVSRTHVWGVLLDSDDLPIVLRYRIV
jgi:hypothetical protein